MSTDDASAALSQIRYSLIVIGTQGSEGPHFMIANWGTQASFDPWRFVVAVKKTARTLQNVEREKAFTVNLVAHGRDDLVKQLLKKKDDAAADEGTVAAPRLAEAYAGLDCRHLQTVDTGGDHMLIVAEVVGGWKSGTGPAFTLPELDLSYAG